MPSVLKLASLIPQLFGSVHIWKWIVEKISFNSMTHLDRIAWWKLSFNSHREWNCIHILWSISLLKVLQKPKRKREQVQCVRQTSIFLRDAGTLSPGDFHIGRWFWKKYYVYASLSGIFSLCCHFSEVSFPISPYLNSTFISFHQNLI